MRICILLLLVFIRLNYGYSKYTVCNTGGDFITILSALNFTKEGDTIEIRNGPRSYNEKLDLSLKKNITIISRSPQIDTIIGDIVLGDGISFQNVHLIFDSMKAFEKGGFSFKNCILEKGKISFCRSDFSYKSRQNLVSNCKLIGIGMVREWNKQLLDRLTIDSSEIIILPNNYKAIFLGENAKFRYNIVTNYHRVNDIATALCFFDDSITVENNYFNGGGICGEFLTFQVADSIHSRNVTLRNNVFDSINHVAFMFDGCRDGDFHNNIFINSSKQQSAISNHQRDPGDSSFNVKIRSNTITGSRALNLTDFGGGPPSSNLTFSKNLMLSEGNINFPFSKIISNVISDCVWGNSNPSIGDGWGVKTNLLFGKSNLVIGDERYPFVKRGGGAILDSTTGEWAGARGYLINVKKVSIDSSGFTVWDSISNQFWYDDPIAKDSGITTLQVSIDRKAWKDADTSLIMVAGSSSQLIAKGSYKYFRLVFNGIGKTKNITDTTGIFTVSLSAEPPQKNKLYNTESLKCLVVPRLTETIFKTYVSEKGIVTIAVYDVLGRMLLRFSFYATRPGVYQHKFPNAHIKTGNTLILKVEQNNVNLIQKIRLL